MKKCEKVKSEGTGYGYMWTCVDMWKSDIYGYMWICVAPRKGKENEIEFIKRGALTVFKITRLSFRLKRLKCPLPCKLNFEVSTFNLPILKVELRENCVGGSDRV